MKAKVPAGDDGTAVVAVTAGTGSEPVVAEVAAGMVVGDADGLGELVGAEDVGIVVEGDGGGVESFTTENPVEPFPVTWPGLVSPTKV